MSIPSSIASSNSNVSGQFQTQQAQRAADQAAQRAQTLQAQAREARSVADHAQANALSLESNATNAQLASNQARVNVQNSANSNVAQFQLNTAYSDLPQKAALDGPASSQVPSGSEQNIGTLINTTA
jgi:hypothetical protein